MTRVNIEEWLERTNVIVTELLDRFQDVCTEVTNNAIKSYKLDGRK